MTSSSPTNDYFTQDVIESVRKAIKDASGNEVFFAAKINSSGIITEAVPAARGNEHSVPVQHEERRSANVLVHNHPGGNLTPSPADIAVAQNASENAQGFYIINNDVTEVYVVVKPVLPKVICPLDEEETAFYISDGGPLAQMSEHFEERPVQISLLKQITKSLNKNKIGVFEAGTGVGKSFAYLIPSLLWAAQNNERVIISTGTINLQQQLCEKDIPMAEKITGKKIPFILMKGRQNYVCKRRFFDCIAQKELFDGDATLLESLSEWVQTSDSGSRSDLAFMPPLSLWTRINSESDACMGMRCPYHTDCFVMKVRKQASGANLIVVNHHLLFADIESRQSGIGYDEASVLPPYRRIVFDEAHGIESAATGFFSESFNRFKVLKQLNLLYRKRKNAESGYLCTLSILSSNSDIVFSAYDLVTRIKNDITSLETACLDLMKSDFSLRLSRQNARSFGPVISLCSTLATSIDEFVALCRKIMEGVSDEDKEIPAFFETRVLLRRLEDACVVLRDFSLWEEKSDNVFWMQKKNATKDGISDESSLYVILTETPLDIAPLMNTGVFEPMESVICTSATLKTGRDFSYWLHRSGACFSEKERLLIGDFPSPFPYKTNMVLAVPKDAPLPEDFMFQQWVESSIPRLIEASSGRALVLFTSYESLKSAFRASCAYLAGSGINLLCQGSDDNARLLELFRKDTESVLFATDSFWQGVDVPGDSLSHVIIVKLPFPVPSDPVFSARSESIQNRGGSSFMELSVPEAVIKFRQGIGRLMRRSSDRGSVTILDRRLYEKRYGSVFLSAVPECKRIYEELSKITATISDFIFN